MNTSALGFSENAPNSGENAHSSGVRAYKSRASGHSAGTQVVVDERLVEAFDALSELDSASSAFAAASIVIHVLDDLIPCGASAVALYDINAHTLRFVATKGASADSRRKAEVHLDQGGCVARAASSGAIVVIDDADEVAHFDALADAPLGLVACNMLLLPITSDHRLRGLIQLIDRRGDMRFSDADRILAAYVADRFARFFAG